MKQTDTVLDKIVAAKQAVVRAQKARRPLAQIEQELKSLKSFKGSGFFEVLKAPSPQPKLIAEVKKTSPSQGVIRGDFSLSTINDAYQSAANVVAISVLTESQHFQGDEGVLAFFADNNTNHKPLLRKDFIFDPYQIYESKLLGAQAYLLIASLFDERELGELVEVGLGLSIEPLVEVHDRRELDLALTTQARVIGVNCRDLRDFSIDLKVHELLRELDDSYARIAESGIDNPEYLQYVSGFADAALVGTSLMTATDTAAAIEELVGVARTAEQARQTS